MASIKRLEQVEEALKDHGVRLTKERRLIVRRAVSYLHFIAEELVKDVQKENKSIARGTVYRTLALLHESGVVEKHDFLYGPPNYEVTFGKAHHDHLMCTQCGEIIEFQAPRVEQAQQEVVDRYKYRLVSHTHKLYGICPTCQRIAPKRPPKHRHPHLHVEEIVT